MISDSGDHDYPLPSGTGVDPGEIRVQAGVNRIVMSGDNTMQGGEFCWEALLADVLHPVDVQIVEALHRIDKSLSADDLAQILDDAPSGEALTRHNLRRLSKLGAIAVVGVRPTCGGMTIAYGLLNEPLELFSAIPHIPSWP